jgi:hypothetical protein
MNNLVFMVLCIGLLAAAKVNGDTHTNSETIYDKLLAGLYGPRARVFEGEPGEIGAGGKAVEAKYQKISKSGKLLADNAIKWRCVYDHSTGLTWEVKTTDHTLHNKNIEFRWGGVNTEYSRLGRYLGRNSRFADFEQTVLAESLRFKDWDYLIDFSNEEKLCGYDDWRIPNLYEMFSLVRCSTRSPDLDSGCGENSSNVPALDLEFFPNAGTDAYWSSSLSAFSGVNNHAWTIHFSNGSDLTKFRGSYQLVRVVRGIKE